MSTAVGLLSCAIASVFFGSAYVPVKRHHPGDGLFVQWLMAVAIWLVGLVVYLLEDTPTFQPLAMLGGMFWAIGNLTAIPIMSQLGIGLGMLVWGTTNVLTGWACGTFGLFGTKAHPPSSPFWNYIGLAMVIIGGVLFSRVEVRPRTQSLTSLVNETEEEVEAQNGEEEVLLAQPSSYPPVEGTSKDKRAIAFAVALLAGVFYGVTFVPVIYIQDHPEKFHDASPAGLPYVFSHFSGILATSSVLFVIYLAVTAGNPEVNPHIVAPSLAAGCMWGIAQSAWFVANENLSQAISFPIIGMLPGVLSALWSVLYFREIRGPRNLRFLCLAVLSTSLGAVFVGLSK